MRKRIFAGALALVLCLSLVQPASGLELAMHSADKTEVTFQNWADPPEALTMDPETGAWELYVSQNITKKALLEQLPKQAEVSLISPEPTPETTPEVALLSNGEGDPVTPPAPAQEPEPTPSQEPESAPSQASEPAYEILDLNWSLTGEFSTLPKGGTLTATASLPEGYVLATGNPLLTITVQAKDPWGDFSKYETQGIDLLGTKINLFDYWTEVDEEGKATPETRFEPDFHGFDHAPFYAFPLRHNGINKNTPLKFWQGGPKGAANPNDYEYNIWTDNKGAPLFGIVKPVLENRYPVLANQPKDIDSTYNTISTGCTIPEHNKNTGERWYADSDKACSLDYLFDPTIPP